MLKFAVADVKILDSVLIPQNANRAARRAIKTAHRHHFTYTPRPGYLYVRSRAISSRCNDNYDEFPAEEIEKGYRTFVGKPVFVNHHNDDHRTMRGVVIDAAIHRDTLPSGAPDTWAEVLMEVDAVKFPKLAKRIIDKDIDRTSMGCDVDYSLCSVCANKATNPAEYCAHIPRMKGQRIYRADPKTGKKEGILVREICYGLRFFENSLLVEEPADPTAFFLGVDDSGLKMSAAKTTALRDQETCPHDGEFNLHGQCKQCGYTPPTESDEECDHPRCAGFPEGWHTKGECMEGAYDDAESYVNDLHDKGHFGPAQPEHQDAAMGINEVFSKPEYKDADWLLDQNHTGPTKWSSLSSMATHFQASGPFAELEWGDPGSMTPHLSPGASEAWKSGGTHPDLCQGCGYQYQGQYGKVCPTCEDQIIGHDENAYDNYHTKWLHSLPITDKRRSKPWSETTNHEWAEHNSYPQNSGQQSKHKMPWWEPYDAVTDKAPQKRPSMDTLHPSLSAMAAHFAMNTDENGWFTKAREGFSRAETDCQAKGHGPWTKDGTCTGCGYNAGDNGDAHEMVDDAMRERLGDHNMEQANYLLDQNHTGPTKWSALAKAASNTEPIDLVMRHWDKMNLGLGKNQPHQRDEALSQLRDLHRQGHTHVQWTWDDAKGTTGWKPVHPSTGVEPIEDAISGYAERAHSAGDTESAPYNSESLAEIYHPRVRQLIDLQNQGFTHARWGRDYDGDEVNKWHGAMPSAGPTKWSSLHAMAAEFMPFDPTPHRTPDYDRLPERFRNGIDATLEAMHRSKVMGHEPNPATMTPLGRFDVTCKHCPNTTSVSYQPGTAKNPGEWQTRGALHASPCQDNPKSLGYQENAGPYQHGEKWTDTEHRPFDLRDEQMYSLSAMASMFKGAPFAGYKDFDACVAANSDKDDPSAYCATIMRKVEKDAIYTGGGGGEDPGEPTLHWRSPNLRYEVHVRDWLPDRSIREGYPHEQGAKPHQVVQLHEHDVDAFQEGAKSRPSIRGYDENGLAGIDQFGNFPRKPPAHVMKHLQQAHEQVKANADTHAELHGAMADQDDIASDLRRVPGDMAAEERGHQMFRNLLRSADDDDHTASLRSMAESFEIPLSDDDRNFYQQMRDAGEMRAQMHEHGMKREVNLADPVDLKAHLCETHDMYPNDFWRNSYDEDHEALDIAHGDDRPLRPHELRALHAYDHKHSPGDYPGVIIGDSHFHSASKTAELSDEEIQHGLDLPANQGEELGKSLWKGMMDIFDPGGTDESRASERRTQTMSDLLDKGHKPEHIKFDEDDEPYAKVTHPSGWHARDRGGVYIGIGHEATGDDEDHDVFNMAKADGSIQKIDRPTLQKNLDHWVGQHGDEYAQNMSDPRIRRWQQRHRTASLDQRLLSPTPIDVVQHKPNDQVTYHCPTCGGYDYQTVPHEQFGQGVVDSLIAGHQCRASRTAAGGSNDRMVQCDQGHDHWGAEGAAGLLLRHRGHDGETRYLLQKRGPGVDSPNTYSIPGGALGQGETPVHGAVREGQEEMGELPNFRVRDTHVNDCGGWKYHTVIADVDHQFDPPGGEDAKEQESTDWHTADEIAGLKLHPGFESSWPDIQERGH